MPTDLEKRLSRPVVELESSLVQRPMIIMGSHNPHILTEYVIMTTTRSNEPKDRTDDVVVTEEQTQVILTSIEQETTQFKLHIWDNILPKVIGFEIAQGEIDSELSQIFGKEVNVLASIAAYRRAMSDAVFASAVVYVSDKLGLTTSQARMILRSKLDEQANRTRPNARVVTTQ